MAEAADNRQGYPTRAAFIALLLVIVPCLLMGWWLGSAVGSAAAGSAATAELGDLSQATFVEIHTLDGKVAMSGELRDHVDLLGNVEKDAALMSALEERVIGEIEIEVPAPGASNRRQELEVDVISLRPATTYRVVINDLPAATFTTDDRGSVDVEFEFTPSVAR